MPLPRLILFSGVGIDPRIFTAQSTLPARLEFPPLIPFQKNEPLPAYATRLAQTIDPTPPFYLGGLSFGGMLALELATRLHPRAVFAISACTNFHQLAPPLQLACRLAPHLSDTIVRQSWQLSPLFFRLVGRPDRQQRRLLLSLADTANPTLTRHSAAAVTNWTLSAPPNTPVHHIHGSDDLIIPAKNLPHIHRLVPAAGHAVNLTHAHEVNAYITSVLLQQNTPGAAPKATPRVLPPNDHP